MATTNRPQDLPGKAPRPQPSTTALGEAWTISLGTYQGTRLRMHLTTAALLFLLAILWAMGKGTTFAWCLVGGSLSLLVHELGHVLAAKRRGYFVHAVIWFPSRGLALIDGEPRPDDEIPVALAGIAANAALALALGSILPLAGVRLSFQTMSQTSAIVGVTAALFFFNLALCVLNAIPALPVDGGRILRAFLTRTCGRQQATQVVAMTGAAFAFLFVALAPLTGCIPLGVIGAFLLLGTAREVQADQVRNALAGVTVASAMTQDFLTLSGGDTLREAARKIQTSAQSDFPVMQGGQVVGVLSRDTLLRGIVEHRGGVYVSEVVNRAVARVLPDDPLLGVAGRFRNPAAAPVLVVADDCLVGMLTAEGLGRYVALQQAMRPTTKPDEGS